MPRKKPLSKALQAARSPEARRKAVETMRRNRAAKLAAATGSFDIPLASVSAPPARKQARRSQPHPDRAALAYQVLLLLNKLL